MFVAENQHVRSVGVKLEAVKAFAKTANSHFLNQASQEVAKFEPQGLIAVFSLPSMQFVLRSILFLSLFIASALQAQRDSIPIDTIPRSFVGIHAVTGPIANGFELKYVLDKHLCGEELSLFFSGSNIQARQFCSEFTDTARTALFVTDHLPFDADISRYEITVRRRNFFAAHYTNVSYSKKRTFGFRRSLGLRMTHWQVETSSRPFFPSGFISFDRCGQGDGLFGSSPSRFEAVDLVTGSSEANQHLVYSLEVGFGFSYRTSPLRRLMLAFEVNVFGLAPLNQARLAIESPGEGASTNYTVETKQQVAINFDLSAGLFWRIR